MANKKGNTDWQKRKKHGRPKALKSPQQLWEYACDYFQECDNSPWEKTDFKGKEVEMVKIPTACPYTWEGLDVFLHNKGVIGGLKDYKSNKEDRYNDFVPIITHIGNIIKKRNLEGATVGAYNSNIVARYLGIKDETKLTGNGEDGNIKIEIEYVNEGM